MACFSSDVHSGHETNVVRKQLVHFKIYELNEIKKKNVAFFHSDVIKEAFT